jgi:hypothetical protein
MAESSEDNEPKTDLEDYFISDSDDGNLEVSFSNLSIDSKYQITWPDSHDKHQMWVDWSMPLCLVNPLSCIVL